MRCGKLCAAGVPSTRSWSRKVPTEAASVRSWNWPRNRKSRWKKSPGKCWTVWLTGRGEVPLLLLLDELQDPQNVGALIRTANAAGVHGVLLPQRRSCPLNAVVAKISAGAIEYVPVIQIGNIPQTMKQLKKRGFWIAGADMDGEDQYFDANLTGPMVLVVGAEGKGLGRLVKENCDFIVRIPMLGQVSSLNASVAGGILLYDIVRQRILEARKKG